MRRHRLLWLALVGIVIVLGLSSRHFPQYLPAFISKNAGDTLWALCVFLFVGFLWPTGSTKRVAAIALAFSYCIEFSQLYHAPWIDALRQTLPGRLILGSVFGWGDLVCYTVGIGIGVGLELFIQRRSKHASEGVV